MISVSETSFRDSHHRTISDQHQHGSIKSCSEVLRFSKAQVRQIFFLFSCLQVNCCESFWALLRELSRQCDLFLSGEENSVVWLPVPIFALQGQAYNLHTIQTAHWTWFLKAWLVHCRCAVCGRPCVERPSCVLCTHTHTHM